MSRRQYANSGRISGTTRWREWRLRLLYKKIHAEHPHIMMSACQGNHMLLTNRLTNRHAHVRNLEEWETQRADFV